MSRRLEQKYQEKLLWMQEIDSMFNQLMSLTTTLMTSLTENTWSRLLRHHDQPLINTSHMPYLTSCKAYCGIDAQA